MPYRPRPRASAESRFWKFVLKTETCWLWQGRKNIRGYGQFHLWDQYGKWKTVAAHRFSYELNIGVIPIGLHLDHLCRTPGCVNPLHLEPVTCRENILRGIGPPAVNSQKTHCKAGHQFSPENTYLNSGGRHRRCKECALKQAEEWKVNNSERRKQTQLQWQRNNRDKMKIYKDRYKEKLNERNG